MFSHYSQISCSAPQPPQGAQGAPSASPAGTGGSQAQQPGENSAGSRCAEPGEDGEGSRYAGAAGLRRALNARKCLIEADILNEAENILYKM